MTQKNEKTTTTPVPAATILLVRDGPAGIEVFMVKRHHEIDFIANALVFPGGKSTKSDADSGIARLMDGDAEWPAHMRVMAVAAIREAFEEAGILLARDARTGNFVDPARLATLQPYRARLERNELGLRELAETEHLRLAGDQLVRFAHWITPAAMEKRFDTHFFIARAPEGHIGAHDEHETVDSVWISPAEAVADRERWKIVFPTRLNLMKLAKAKRVEDALQSARAALPPVVEPWIEEARDGTKILRVREDAGYDITALPMLDASGSVSGS